MSADNIVPLPPHRLGLVPAASQRSAGEGMSVHVSAALRWLRDHPQADYLDAATAVAQGRGGEISQAGWPDFLARVKQASGVSSALERELRAEGEREAEG